LYTTKLVGDGTENNEYRSIIADLGVVIESYSQVSPILVGPRQGHPRLDWCITEVVCKDWSPFDSLESRGFIKRIDRVPVGELRELAKMFDPENWVKCSELIEKKVEACTESQRETILAIN
jgi:hypothetical protein